MEEFYQYVTNYLKNYRFQGKPCDLLEKKDIDGFHIKDDVLTCIININDRNQQYIKLLTEKLIVDLKHIKGIKDVKFSFTKNKQDKVNIPKVKKTILISSGKGGVGKSTITLFLAQYLQKQGFNTGILDADIHGPSLPTFTNITKKPPIEEGIWIPHIWNNIAVNSIGYLIPNDEALIWRGPMISKSIQQLLINTLWPNLDYLLIDMPPGTGDIHLSITKHYKVDGCFIVSTPHRLSIADTARTIKMYQTLSIPILGIINNMAYLENKTQKQYIFGTDQELVHLAQTNKTPIVTHIPISPTNQINIELFKNTINFLPPL